MHPNGLQHKANSGVPGSGCRRDYLCAITNTQDESKSLLVALSSKYVKGLPTTGWPMRAKDAQHTATVK